MWYRDWVFTRRVFDTCVEFANGIPAGRHELVKYGCMVSPLSRQRATAIPCPDLIGPGTLRAVGIVVVLMVPAMRYSRSVSVGFECKCFGRMHRLGCMWSLEQADVKYLCLGRLRGTVLPDTKTKNNQDMLEMGAGSLTMCAVRIQRYSLGSLP